MQTTTFQTLRTEHDAEQGVFTAWFDLPGKTVNVLDEAALRDLQGVLDACRQAQPLRLLVFRSAKPGCFLAGADLTQLERLSNAGDVEQVLRAGQQLFDRLAEFPVPTVAVIEGTCLGGGLEFAMACRFRVAVHDASTRLGLPETQLGLIPAWGGTQRLPRLVGVQRALEMILEGRRLSAAQACAWGLVDAAFSRPEFEQQLQAFLKERMAGCPLPARRQTLGTWLRDRTRWGQRLVLYMARRRVANKAPHYPALRAALNAIDTGLRKGHAQGLQEERTQFAQVLATPASKNLRQLFFLREKARKVSTWVSEAAPTPRTVAVIGAGTMGAGIAQALAVSGLKVVVKELDARQLEGGLARIDNLFRDAVKAGVLTDDEAHARRGAIRATTEWEPLAAADLAIEAVLEQLPVKRDVFRELDRVLRPEAILVSNTSALPVGELAAVTTRPDRVAGLHFFNPVHKMPLVEIVRSRATGDSTLAVLVGLVRQLGKVPLIVAEHPGFLVNRILFPYLDEAVRLVCEGVPVTDVDRAAVTFGMPMGPLELLDYVGIDVAADVARTLSGLSAEPSPTPDQLNAMRREGSLGKKSGRGFYSYRGGRKTRPVISAKGTPKLPPPAGLGQDELSGVQQRLVFTLLNEAVRCLVDGVVQEAWMVDLGLVLGAGYAPFRGGPLQTLETWGAAKCVDVLERLTRHCGPRFMPCEMLRDRAHSGAILSAAGALRTEAER
jgi:3-hydroxyacyl-CoA dehydrogenase/enoyl-CoA hydratase/3-hydroxybutyryl-CoA epimerase